MTEPRMTHDQARDLAAGYVLGALDPADDAAVRDHLATCREAHPEFAAFGEVVPALIELGDLELVEPPPSLGARIMAAAAADLEERRRAAADLAERPGAAAARVDLGQRPGATADLAERRGAAADLGQRRSAAAAGADLGQRRSAGAAGAAPLAALPDAFSPTVAASSPAPVSSSVDAPVAFPSASERVERVARRERGGTSRFDWALRIAAVVAIVAAGAWGLNLQRQLDAAQRFDQAVASVIHAAGQPDAKTVVLTAAKDSTASGIGAVAGDGSVVLAMRDLPATTGRQVYEAWVIVGKTAPLAVGGFTVDDRGIASFKTDPASTPSGATIALTLEPTGGNTAPQGPVVAAGVAVAPPASS